MYNKKVLIQFSWYTQQPHSIVLPSATSEQAVFYKPLVSGAKPNAACFIVDLSQIHVSSFQLAHQQLCFQFWFSSMAMPQSVLPLCIQLCFMGNTCHPKLPAVGYPNLPHPRSQIFHLNRNLPAKAPGLACWLSELAGWLSFPLTCCALLGMMNDSYFLYPKTTCLRKTTRSSKKIQQGSHVCV